MNGQEFHLSAPVILSRDVRCTRVFEDLPGGITDTDYNDDHAEDDFWAALRRILISDVRVRWTGHFAAISISLSRCSSLNAPVSSTSASILSSIPSSVSHSSQSFA